MKKHPMFVGNEHGACVPYAVANALHFVEKEETGENYAERMLTFYPAFKDGYLVGEIDGMLKIADPEGELLANILHYNEDIKLSKKGFFNITNLWQLSERVKDLDREREIYTTFIFFVAKGGVAHAVSGYISLDNFALILMDSAGQGSVELYELETFFSTFNVYGAVQIGIENVFTNPVTGDEDIARIPYLIERKTIQLWK